MTNDRPSAAVMNSRPFEFELAGGIRESGFARSLLGSFIRRGPAEEPVRSVPRTSPGGRTSV